METRYIIIIAILIIVTLAVVSIFISPQYDFDCLEDKAEDYCDNLGLGYSMSGAFTKFFFCVGEHDERISKTPKKDRFYFLEKERESCMNKEALSFKGFEWR